MDGVELLVRIKPCEHGTGCFAIKDYAAGDVIDTVSGGQLDSMSFNRFHIGTKIGYWWPLAWIDYLDDGKENSNVKWDQSLEPLSATIIALRDIKAGEELLVEYSTLVF